MRDPTAGECQQIRVKVMTTLQIIQPDILFSMRIQILKKNRIIQRLAHETAVIVVLLLLLLVHQM